MDKIEFFLNAQQDKKHEKSPDWWGFVEIDGKKYKAAGWSKTNRKGDYISVALTAEGASGGPKRTENKQTARDLEDEIPFD